MRLHRVSEPNILGFPQASKPPQKLETPNPNSARNLARRQFITISKFFGDTPSLAINQILEAKQGKPYTLRPEAFTSDGSLDTEALLTLINFISNGDPEFAKKLGAAQRLSLVSKLINKSFKLSKPEYDSKTLARKLIVDLSAPVRALNSAELAVLENPNARKEFIKNILAAAAAAQKGNARAAHKLGMNDFRDLQKLLFNIHELKRRSEK